MLKYQSIENIIYKTYTNSSVETGYYENCIKPDSISNIIKNKTIIMHENSMPHTYRTIEHKKINPQVID